MKLTIEQLENRESASVVMPPAGPGASAQPGYVSVAQLMYGDRPEVSAQLPADLAKFYESEFVPANPPLSPAAASMIGPETAIPAATAALAPAAVDATFTLPVTALDVQAVGALLSLHLGQ